MPSSTRSAPASAYALPIASDVLHVREAAHEVRHQRSALAGGGERLGDAVSAAVAHERSRTSARSLSPRPDRQMRSSWRVRGLAQRVVERVGGLERRDDALEPRDQLVRLDRVVVLDRDVRRAAAVAQPGVLGTRARVVEPGRDRVRLLDLAVVVLEHRRQRAVQDAGQAARGERGAVAAGHQALPRRLDADELDVLVVDEAGEHADRVRPAADARDDAVGQAAGALEQLGARLVADDALQLADDRRVRRRADRRAEDVVRGLDVRDPVADRLGDGLLQRLRAPTSTLTTSAPSSFIRWTLGCWRRMSSAPM